jgi:large subunit ribosomal protein L18
MRSLGFKRKREGKTDYRRRLKLLQANKPRLVVRKSLKNILAQVVEYGASGDKIVVSCHSGELNKYGWKGSKSNIPAGYLIGLLIGSKAKNKNISFMILDIGLQKSVPGGRIYSVLRGCIDAGISIPHSDNVLPGEDRVRGKHIKGFNANQFDEVKNKILGAKNA